MKANIGTRATTVLLITMQSVSRKISLTEITSGAINWSSEFGLWTNTSCDYVRCTRRVHCIVRYIHTYN